MWPTLRLSVAAAVIVAAGLVAWTKTPWPDLIVALVIAGLFRFDPHRVILSSVHPQASVDAAAVVDQLGSPEKS